MSVSLSVGQIASHRARCALERDLMWFTDVKVELRRRWIELYFWVLNVLALAVRVRSMMMGLVRSSRCVTMRIFGASGILFERAGPADECVD